VLLWDRSICWLVEGWLCDFGGGALYGRDSAVDPGPWGVLQSGFHEFGVDVS